jgi:hypothetical protein
LLVEWNTYCFSGASIMRMWPRAFTKKLAVISTYCE